MSLFMGGMANAEVPQVRIWIPFQDDTQVFSCLQTDLRSWSEAFSKQRGEAIFPHRFIDLPEGRYIDQIRASIATGEQPHLVLLEDTQPGVLLTPAEGKLFGADLIGIWVDEGALASFPRALTSLTNIWTGEAETSVLALDELLILIAGQGTLPLAIDIGPQGLDLGLVMSLVLKQWTGTFDTFDPPNWQDERLGEVLETLTRWQQEGLMEEVDLAALRSSAGLMPFLTFGRYSAGKNFGAEFAFYPLFSTMPEQGARFLEIPYYWHVLREDETVILQDILAAIEVGGISVDGEAVFETCAESAGLLSRLQMLEPADAALLDNTSEDQEESSPQSVTSYRRRSDLGQFVVRPSQVFPKDLLIEFWQLDELRKDVPLKLADTLRDMRAGLSLQNALDALEAE